jgi:hypothetical protein
MSAINEHFAAYPNDWIQPVRYDHAAYRSFASKLDSSLAELVAEHGSRRTHAVRSTSVTLERHDLVDSQTADSQTEKPPEQTSC